MASGPTLPPQAYTREVLTSAFNWLQTQPESVRKLATTPDALVGLYTRAKRFGASSLEADAPVSGQNFMSDLKNLAEGLKQFEEPKSNIGVPHPAGPLFSHASSANPISAHTALHPVGAPNSSPNLGPQTVLNQMNQVNHVNQIFTPSGGPVESSGLNERSRAMIQEVKDHLNLSSDTEVINMMLALAYKSLKNLLN